jgi:hypothetical protein
MLEGADDVGVPVSRPRHAFCSGPVKSLFWAADPSQGYARRLDEIRAYDAGCEWRKSGTPGSESRSRLFARSLRVGVYAGSGRRRHSRGSWGVHMRPMCAKSMKGRLRSEVNVLDGQGSVPQPIRFRSARAGVGLGVRVS